MTRDYLTVSQAAEAWGCARQQVQRYITEGRVPGAEKLGPIWLIPAGTPCPRKTTWRRGPKPGQASRG